MNSDSRDSRLHDELEGLNCLLKETSSFVTNTIFQIFGISYEPRCHIFSESYPGLIEFSSTDEPLRFHSTAVIVLRTKDWILYKVHTSNLHIRWWRSEVADVTWQSVLYCRTLQHCEVDQSLNIALQGWIAYVCCERNKDLAANLLLPEYSTTYCVEVFDEFYCSYTDIVNRFSPDQLYACGNEIIKNLVGPTSMIESDCVADVFQTTPPYLKTTAAGGVIFNAMLQHILHQHATYDKVRGVKFLLPALRRACEGLREPRTHGLPVKWHSTGVLMPSLLTGLFEWKESILSSNSSRNGDNGSYTCDVNPGQYVKAVPTAVSSDIPRLAGGLSGIATNRQHLPLSSTNAVESTISAAYDRCLNVTRWALELAICLFFCDASHICTKDSLQTHMDDWGNMKISPVVPIEAATIIRLAHDEFITIGGLEGCLQKLSHLISKVSTPTQKNYFSCLPLQDTMSSGNYDMIQVEVNHMEIVLQSESNLLAFVNQLYMLDEYASGCIGLVGDAKSGVLRKKEAVEIEWQRGDNSGHTRCREDNGDCKRQKMR